MSLWRRRLVYLGVLGAAGSMVLPSAASPSTPGTHKAPVTSVDIRVGGGGDLRLTLPEWLAQNWRFHALRTGGTSAYARPAPAPSKPPTDIGPLPWHEGPNFPGHLPASAGTIASIAGGACETYPAREATISPTRVAIDHAGRLFWVDQTAATAGGHAGASPLIRTIDPQGRVRTLGSIFDDIGRSYRQSTMDPLTDASWLTTIVPDQHGGVFTNVIDPVASADNFGHTSANFAGEPAQPSAIVDLHADGRRTLVVGGLPSSFRGQYSGGQGEGDPVTHTSLNVVEGFTTDDAGDVYFADGTQFHTEIGFANRGAAPVVFYPGTPYQKVIAPGRIGVIAGIRLQDNVNSTLDFAAESRPVPAMHAILDEVPKLELHDGVLYVLNTDVDRNNPYDFRSRPSDVQAINLFSPLPITRYGVTILPGWAASVAGDMTQQSGYLGDGGPAVAAQFGFDWAQLTGDFTVDPDGPLYIADTRNQRVRMVSPLGIVTTIAGTGTPGDSSEGTPGILAHVWDPLGLTLDLHHRPVFADWGNARIRRVDADGTLHTVAGRGPTPCGDGHYATGPGLHDGAYFGRITAVATDSHGDRFVADSAFNIVREISPAGRIIRTIGEPSRCAGLWWTFYEYPNDAITPDSLTTCPELGPQSADGSLTSVRFASPTHLVVDSYDNLIVSDVDRVRYINLRNAPLSVDGIVAPPRAVTTLRVFPNRNVSLTGTPIVLLNGAKCQWTPPSILPPGILPPNLLPPGVLPDPGNSLNCNPVTVQLTEPIGDLAVDSDGSIYVADPFLHLVYRLGRCNTLDIVAGNGHAPRFAGQGDGTPATTAPLTPQSLTIDRIQHVLLIADYNDIGGGLTYTGSNALPTRVRGLDLGLKPVASFGTKLTPGRIQSVAGDADCAAYWCSNGDGGPAARAAIAAGAAILLGADRRLYITEGVTNMVRVVTRAGRIYGLAGPWPENHGETAVIHLYDEPGQYAPGYAGDGGPAADAWFSWRSPQPTEPAELTPFSPPDAFATVGAMAWSPTGDLLVTDRIGRVRRIADVTRAPLRATSMAPAPLDAGRGFSVLTFAGSVGRAGVSIPSTVTDPTGHTYLLAGEGAGRGCDLWLLDRNTDHRGHDAFRYLGQPSLAADPTLPNGRIDSGSGGESCRLAATSAGLAVVSIVRARDAATGGSDLSLFTAFSADDRSWRGSALTATTDQVAGLDISLAARAQTSAIVYRTTSGETKIAQSADAATYSAGTSLPVDAVQLGDIRSLPAGGYALGLLETNGSTWQPRYSIAVATSHDLTRWHVARLAVMDQATAGLATAPTLAVDSHGQLHAAWSDGRHVLLSSQSPTGRWGAPQAIPGGAVSLLPSVFAGPNGGLAIAFYSTLTGSSAAADNAEWYPFVDATSNVNGATTQWTTRVATATPVYRGGLCQQSQCPSADEATGVQITAIQCADSTGQSCPWDATAFGPNGRLGPPVLQANRDGTVSLFTAVAAGAAGNPGPPTIAETRDCTGLLLGVRRQLVPCASNPVATLVNAPTEPTANNLADPNRLPLATCSPLPPPFVMSGGMGGSGHRPHPTTPAYGEAPPAAQGQAALAVGVDPPVDPASINDATSSANQLSQGQQPQSSHASQPNVGTGLATDEADDVQYAEQYAMSRNRRETPVELFVGAAALMSAAAGFSWRRSQLANVARRTAPR